MLTAQQIFDKVVDHLAKQGKRSLSFIPGTDLSKCMYRGEEGSMCAVGCLIPDDKYNPNWESKSLIELVSSHPDFVIAMGSAGIDVHEHRGLLDELQTIHDVRMKAGFTKRTIDGLSGVAEYFGLEFNAEKMLPHARILFSQAR